jgi:ATP-dependent RNA helicase DDX20
LRAEGFTPIFIHGDQSQSDRIKIMHQMRRNKVNLIISTDLVPF